MRVAVIHSFYGSSQPSGENVVVDQQVAALEAFGHDVRLIARRTDELAERRGYQAKAGLTVATGYGFTPLFTSDSWTPDVIHLHNTFPNIGTRWLRGWGNRTVATLHNYRTVCAAGTLHRDGQSCVSCPTSDPRHAVRHRCYRDSRIQTLPLAVGTARRGGLRRVLADAGELIVLNERMHEFFRPLTNRPMSVVPNFIEVPATTVDRRTSSWVYAGRVAAEKGLREVIEAWPDDRALEVFGDGPDRHELMKASPSSIRWHGVVPREEMLHALARSRGLIVPSLWPEGLPSVILEAFALRTPVVISTKVSACAVLSANGVVMAYDPENPRTLLPALMSAEADGASLTKRAADYHQDHFSKEAWLNAVEPVYRRVASAAH